MHNRFAAFLFAGLLAFGVAACDDSADTGTEIEAPAGDTVDPAAPADGADPAMSDPALGDPALEPTE